MGVHKHIIYNLEPKKQPRFTKGEWEAILIISTWVLSLIGFFMISFMLITSPYGG